MADAAPQERSFLDRILGTGATTTPESEFFKRLLTPPAKAASISPATPPPAQTPQDVTASPPPGSEGASSYTKDDQKAVAGTGVFNTPEDYDKLREEMRAKLNGGEKTPAKKLGSVLPGEEGAPAAKPAGSPTVGRVLASPTERSNSDAALMASLLSFGLNTLLAPQWSTGQSILGGVSAASDTYNKFNEQRQKEVEEEKAGRKTEAEIRHLDAQSKNQLAHAATAGLDSKAQIELLKAQKPDKNSLEEILAQAPGLLLKSGITHAAQGTDVLTGKTPAQQVQELIESAKQLEAQKLATTRAMRRHTLQQRVARGEATVDEIVNDAPDAIARAKANPNAADYLRKVFKSNPTELAKLEKLLK